MNEYNLSRTSHEYEDSEEIWGGVTDPNYHNPEKFRYLILPRQINSHFTLNTKESRKEVFKLSLIDEQHPVDSDVGFIVKVPESSVISTSEHRTRFQPSDLGRLAERSQKYGMMNADTLLRYTAPETTNEIIAATEHATRDELITGIFARRDLPRQVIQKLHDEAEKRDVPLVYLPRTAVKTIKSIGRRSIESSDQGIELLPPRSAIDSVIDFAIRHGALSRDQANKIIDTYEMHSKIQRSTHVDFGENGDIEKIVHYDVFGESIETSTIDRSGKAYRITPDNDSVTSIQSLTPLSPEEAISIFERAAKTLGPRDLQIAQQWFDERMPTIRRRWSSFMDATVAKPRTATSPNKSR